MLRSILEEALTAIIEHDEETAQKKLHQFIVARSRAIHESLRESDELVLEDDSDNMYSDIDLANLSEDDEDGDEAADTVADDLGAGDDDAVSGDDLGDGDDLSDDGSDDIDGDDLTAGDDTDADGEGATLDDLADRLDAIEDHEDDIDAQIAKLIAALEDGGEFGDDEEASDDEVVSGDDEVDAMDDDSATDDLSDEGTDEDSLEIKDDMTDEDEMKESALDEDFDDLAESIVSTLKTVMVDNTEGRTTDGKKQTIHVKAPTKTSPDLSKGQASSEGTEQGGKKTKVNTKATFPAASKDKDRLAGGPTKIDTKKKTDFKKETSPEVKKQSK